MYITA